MLMPRVIPCLLLKDKGLVKTVKFRLPTYLGDPINIVRIFNDKEVDELIFLDITATLEKKGPSFDFVWNIASECFMPVCYGGGISGIEEMKMLFDAGIEKIAINTAAVRNPSIIENAANKFGSQSVVVSMDVKKNWFGKYRVYTHCGRKATDLEPVEWALQVQELGAGELLVNSIDQDGTMSGYDFQLIKKVTKAVTIPVIACGGASELNDIVHVVKQSGASAAAVGSIFVFYGTHRSVLINYPSRQELESVFNHNGLGLLYD